MIERTISSMLDEKNQEELMEIIIDTFEKQVSKKPKLQHDSQYICPECDSRAFKHYHYCPNCGQKLDWSDFV